MKLNDLVQHISHTGASETDITAITYDSRKACAGSLFVCLVGAWLDGHTYAESAYQNGCRAFLVEHRVDLPADAVQIVTDDTRAALAGFESEYGVHLSDEESGLVAVIFGAWLMQENDLHEKQIILLTGNDSEREAQIEQQLRELTLLPLNIKHMSVKAFLQTGAPRGAALIIAPYTMPLPLFSPPLIYTDLTLTTHQQEQIRKMLESA